VERVLWRSDGLPIVSVGDFDTDEVGTESKAIELLLEVGWQIDVA
jgi:hypothetical protein